uniref:Rad21_Rec8_N domain-containing protein n=1 Tax=Caenorhabditis tropicalis TaxID=1561998 RepID=A0A1I7TWE8_9PELO
MFYADFVLSKKGPLSKVWLAAHWEKKLSKAQIYETNVDEAVNEIMRPSQNLALRTTGHLLLGICRVFSRKTKYLLADCNEAFLKIKLVFKNGALDEPNPVLPTFTMQDIYGEFGDNVLPEFDDEELNHAPICQSRLDDITLKEDLPQRSSYNYGDLLEDDDFGELAAGVGPEDYFKLMEEVKNMDVDFDLEKSNGNSDKGLLFGRSREPTPALKDAHAPGNTIFEDDYTDDRHDDDEDEHNHQSTSGYDHAPMNYDDMDYDQDHMMNMRSETPLRDETPFRAETPSTFRGASPAPSVTQSIAGSTAASTAMEQDTVESYYARQAQKRAMQKELNMKKRRVDDVRMITGEEMKANMADYSDTLTRLDLAPPTRSLMLGKKRSHAEFMLHHPGMIGFSKNKQFIRMYQCSLTFTKCTDSEEKNEKIKNALGLWDIGEEDLQQQQHEMDMHIQDDPQYDDFDEVAPLDYDNYDMDMPQSMDELNLEDDVPMRNPLSPYATMTDGEGEEEEDSSPAEKRRKVTTEGEKEEEGDEDNRWSKRTHALLQTINNKLAHQSVKQPQVELDDMFKKGTTRKTAAAKFYSLLCLKKNQCVEVEQQDPYGEIIIKPGPNINAQLF